MIRSPAGRGGRSAGSPAGSGRAAPGGAGVILAAAAAAALTAGPGVRAQAHGHDPGAAPAPSLPSAAGATGAGQSLFQSRCASCHEPAVGRAPPLADLSRRPQADIVTAMTSGIMAPMARGLTAGDMAAIAAYISPAAAQIPGADHRPLQASLLPATADPKCPGASPPITPGASDWTTAGFDPASTRFQPRPGMSAADVPRLKLKWSFSMSGGGQPTVVGDWLFTTNRSGRFYALDARSGCVRWVAEGIVSRTTPLVVRSPVSPSGWLTLAGTADRTVRAFDAQTGQPLWRSAVLESHPVSVLTGSPVVAQGRVYVPISSIEEAAAMSKSYPCCTFRGSVAALDLTNGRLLWRTLAIDEPLRPLGKNPAGVQMQGPAGAAIWSAPTVDVKRGLLYVVTGDSYTDAETKGADAVMALDLNDGHIRWRRQVTAGDNFVMGCNPAGQGSNCPSPVGPDYDFGASPVLMKTSTGREVLAAGQKSGLVYGFDPDTGSLLWTTRVGAGSALGGVEWGIAADRRRLFVPVADMVTLMMEAAGRAGPGAAPARPGLYALDPADGRLLWSAPAPAAPCAYAPNPRGPATPCLRAQSAAPAATPQAVFSGTTDGWLRAYDPASGKILWAYSTTAQTYATVNGVTSQPGGSIDGMGPTVAGGRLFVMSGFNGASRVGSNGVNVLLAFSVDGK